MISSNDHVVFNIKNGKAHFYHVSANLITDAIHINIFFSSNAAFRFIKPTKQYCQQRNQKSFDFGKNLHYDNCFFCLMRPLVSSVCGVYRCYLITSATFASSSLILYSTMSETKEPAASRYTQHPKITVSPRQNPNTQEVHRLDLLGK